MSIKSQNLGQDDEAHILKPDNQVIGPAAGYQEITPVELLEAELSSLDKRAEILKHGRFVLLLAKADEIPLIMHEIGRLREITFREVCEGTGKDIDLDVFDTYYWQLFIWDAVARKVVGGYRIGQGDWILQHYGIAGLYISSLFEIDAQFQSTLHQSVELGRSFVIKAYQKQRLPLLLLWKGILHFILRHSEYRYLTGPVSISRYYSDVSKSLIVAFVKAHCYDAGMARYINPRTPFKPDIQPVLEEKLQTCDTIEALDRFIEKIEPEHIRLPVLLKQYVRQNARFIGFNLDPNFSNALDGLMILDLHRARHETIEYLQRTW